MLNKRIEELSLTHSSTVTIYLIIDLSWLLWMIGSKYQLNGKNTNKINGLSIIYYLLKSWKSHYYKFLSLLISSYLYLHLILVSYIGNIAENVDFRNLYKLSSELEMILRSNSSQWNWSWCILKQSDGTRSIQFKMLASRLLWNHLKRKKEGFLNVLFSYHKIWMTFTKMSSKPFIKNDTNRVTKFMRSSLDIHAI